jgi:L-asparaginase
VLACGGTISSVDSGSGAVPVLAAAALAIALADMLDPDVEVEARTYSTVASSALTLADAVAVHDIAARWVADCGSEVAGVVVTHGTDTLEETAYVLDLLWRSDVPVVVTGAMRAAGAPGADGPANLRAAAATALSADAQGAGVLVVMNDRIHLAACAVKQHTTDVATFSSPTLGPVGWFVEGRAHVALVRRQRSTLDVRTPDVGAFPVAVVPVPLGDDGRLLDAVVGAGYCGAVVAALGGGHLPPAAADRLPLAVPTVLASRAGAGPVLEMTYGFAGSERDLLARGLITAGVLPPSKARVLLTLLLAAGVEQPALAAAFARHAHLGA